MGEWERKEKSGWDVNSRRVKGEVENIERGDEKGKNGMEVGKGEEEAYGKE